MKKIFTLLFVVSVLSLGFSQSVRVSEPLKESLRTSTNEAFSIRIMMKDQVDVRGMHLKFRTTKAPQAIRSQQLNAALKAKAKNTQNPILEILEKDALTSNIHSLWIANCIYATVSRATIAELESRTDIDHLALNSTLKVEKVDEMSEVLPPAPNGREIGLERINAHKMWARGYTGRGVIAMGSDTGTNPDHPALANYIGKYNGNEEGFFLLNSPGVAPSNCNFHGSHTLGTAIGLDRINRDTIGVAFNAAWIAARTICGDTPNENDNLASWQWALDPDGDSTTVADMPAGIINSWWDPQEDDECNSPYVNGLEVTEAAGIAVIFSAGNAGSAASTITAPKNINYDLLNSFCVANLNGNNDNLTISGSSSRGPSICGGDSLLTIKPEVAAPGSSVRSAGGTGNDYVTTSGTSMAAPHVVGAVVLLKEAFPFLLGRDFKEALYMSARDLGEPGEDNVYGRGIIDVDAAFLYLVDQGHVPVDPELALDPVLVNVEAPAFFCSSNVGPIITIENQGTDTLRTLEILLEVPDAGISEVSTWTGELVEGERTSFISDVLDIPSGNWEMTLTLQNPNGEADMFLYNNRINTVIGILDRLPFEAYAADTENGSVCMNTEVVLRNEFRDERANSIEYQWYDDPLNGNLLGNGQAFLTSAIEEDVTYYADYVANYSLGLENNESTDTRVPPIAIGGIEFDVLLPLTLNSVLVYTDSRGICEIELEDSEGNSMVIREVFLGNIGENRLILGIDIPIGTGYTLKLNRFPLSLSTNGAEFPYELDGIARLTGNSIGVGDAYYYFYDWEVEHNEPCGRVPVEITVDPTTGAPIAEFGISSKTVDINNDPTIEFTDISDGAESWDWNFGDGARSNEQNPTYTYAAVGEYFVSLTVANANGCTASFVDTVQVVDASSSSTKNLKELTNFEVFPNPTDNILYIETDFDTAEDVTIELTDLLGRPLQKVEQKRAQNSTFQLNTSELTSGIYMLVIKTNNGRAVRKVMKM